MYLNQKKNSLVLFFFCVSLLPLLSQSTNSDRFKVIFYNVENMFDHLNDSLKNDGEFTPKGVRAWNYYKSQEKVKRIAKVIIASGEMHPVGLIGVAEVENKNILNQLIFASPLKEFNYRVLHKESPDKRGIDVALLYSKKEYNPLDTKFISVTLPNDTSFKTRDILYSKGVVKGKDTIHVFVNHWPSRYGGVMATKPLRCLAATKLKHIVDSVLLSDSLGNVIIMGDFNDYPEDESIKNCLGASKNSRLVNLALYCDQKGSYKYQGRWGFLDQIIVNKALFERKSGGLIIDRGQKVVALPFMLEKDETFTGLKPYRTFLGYRYHGGFSDHLPVMIILK